MDHVLTLLIVIPIAGLIPLFMFFRDARAVKQVAIVTTFIELVVSLVMLAQFHVGEAGFQLVESAAWLPSFGIRYELGVDGISVLLIPMTTLLTFISVLYSSGGAIKERIGEFMAAFLLLEVGMVGVFMALDLFLFYVFFELMLVPMYLIIGIWGGPRRVYATLKFVLFTLAGSLLMLVGIIAVYLAERRRRRPHAVAPRAAHALRPLLRGLPVLGVPRLRARVRDQDADGPVPHLAAGRARRGADGRLDRPRRASS